MVCSRVARCSLRLCEVILVVSLFTAGAGLSARALTDSDAGHADSLSSTILRGVTTADLSSALRQKFGIDAELTGVLVTEVAENTPAAAAGLRRDDLVQTVGIYSNPLMNRVTKPEDFYRLAEKAAGGVRLLVRHRTGDGYAAPTWVLVRDSHSAPPAASSGAESPDSPTDQKATKTPDEIEKTISSIRRGPHGTIPRASAESKKLGGKTGMTVKNGTGYTLFLYLSGPTRRIVEIPAGETRDVDLLAGRYEVAAKASKPEVVPFYGVKLFDPDTLYSETFHIETRKD